MTWKDQLVLAPIEQADPSDYDAAVRGYFAHYGLDGGPVAGVEHRFGTFESGGLTLAGHVYRPPEPVATVLLLHGYLNHTGQFRHLIAHLLKNGFAVAAYDLPGHGLSGGATAEIDDFDRYGQTTRDFLARIKPYRRGPVHAVGFSTGGAIVIDMLLSEQAAPLEKIVLAGPLIHWTAYEQSKATYKVYRTFTDKIARFHRKNSSDKDFLRFNKTQDELHAKYLSLRWVKALFDWNDRLAAAAPCDRELCVLQGDKDGTVDWPYNLKLIEQKFPRAQVTIIPGANHELFNEAPVYKQQALNAVTAYFTQEETKA